MNFWQTVKYIITLFLGNAILAVLINFYTKDYFFMVVLLFIILNTRTMYYLSLKTKLIDMIKRPIISGFSFLLVFNMMFIPFDLLVFFKLPSLINQSFLLVMWSGLFSFFGFLVLMASQTIPFPFISIDDDSDEYIKDIEEFEDIEEIESFERMKRRNMKRERRGNVYREEAGNISREEQGNVEREDYDNNDFEEGGNTESGSEQYNFSKMEKSKGINYQNQSAMDEKAKNGDVKQIVYNQENSVVIDKKSEDIEQYKKDKS